MNLLECMRNDWELSGKSLLELLPGKVAPWQVALWQSLLRSLKVTFGGAEIALDLKQRLREDPSPMQTITMAYLKLATEAKERRKSGDPWPVIIIDEANALSEWEDKKPLLALLKFFVFITKQKQLAHGERAGLLVPSRVRVKPHACLAVVLATSDTFLLNWLESGASALMKLPFGSSHSSPCVLQGLSSRPSATRTRSATCRATRLAHSFSTTSSPPKRRLAPSRRGIACTRCAAATPVHCATAPQMR